MGMYIERVFLNHCLAIEADAREHDFVFEAIGVVVDVIKLYIHINIFSPFSRSHSHVFRLSLMNKVVKLTAIA